MKSDDSQSIAAFVRRIAGNLHSRFEGRLISRSHYPSIQADIDREWKIFSRSNPGPWLLAEGCTAMGLKAEFYQGKLFFHWLSGFLDGPRYPAPLPGLSPLGYWKQFDLYYKYTFPSLATVFAASDSGRLERNLHYHNVERPPLVINEGLRRAMLANAFYGSQWSKKPQSLESLGLPGRLLGR